MHHHVSIGHAVHAFFVDRAPRVIAPRCGSARSSVACGRNRSASITSGIFVFFDQRRLDPLHHLQRRDSLRLLGRCRRGCVRTPRPPAPASTFASRSRSGGTAFAFASDSANGGEIERIAPCGNVSGPSSDHPRGFSGSAFASGGCRPDSSVTPAPAAMSAANARPPADGPPVAASCPAAQHPSRAPRTCAETSTSPRQPPTPDTARRRRRRRRTIPSPVLPRRHSNAPPSRARGPEQRLLLVRRERRIANGAGCGFSGGFRAQRRVVGPSDNSP